MGDHLAKFKTLKVNHPDFSFIYRKGFKGYPIVIFERDTWIKATEEELIWYEQRRAAVEALGGFMKLSPYEIAGKNPVFTKEDIASMIAAVERDLPKYRIVESWNGLGCLSFSVAIERRKK